MTSKAKQNDEATIAMDVAPVKSVLMAPPDFLPPVVQAAVPSILEVAMEACLQAGKHERSDQRLGYRSGYYRRRLITRVGTRVLRVAQDRAGQCSTQVFAQYQRSEKALVAARAQRYVQGVSTRKVAAITAELWGHEFSASSLSAITAKLDEQLEQFSRRKLEGEFPYGVGDARYERGREGGVMVSRAILIALGIDWEGRRQVWAVESANRESQSRWREFLLQLPARGLHGVQYIVSDDHPGLKAAIREVLPGVGGSGVLCLSCGTRWITCRARRRTTVCRNCGGCMRGATSRKPAGICGGGWRSGRQNIRSSARGWKRTSKRRGRFTGCRWRTTNI